MVKFNYAVAVLLLYLSLLSIAVGETPTDESIPSDIGFVSIESVPLSLIDELDSRYWSSSFSDYNVQENGSLFDEVKQDYMNLHFSVGPDSGLDLQSLQDEVLRQIGDLLGSDQYFSTAALIACTRDDLVMYLQLRYTITLDYEHQKKVIKTIYNAVEIDGYLGTLNVFHLYVQDTRGAYIRIDDICDVDGCQNGMVCASNGLQCMWNCSLNIGYCPENSKCVDKQTNGFYCRCDHDTINYKCENTTEKLSTSLGSPWTKIIVTVTGSVLVCVLVVCVTIKVIHVYYTKQNTTCRNHRQRAVDLENNSITTAISDTMDIPGQAEFQFLLPGIESDLTSLITNGSSLQNVNGEISNAFLLIDNHEHF